jgi:hypothetical protein
MAIDRIDFENLGEADLQELVATQVPEGLRIEYKRDTYGSADADKREALKDVSAFANSHGGHLVIGIEARDGIPVAAQGVVGMSADEEILRLEQLIRSGIEPRIVNVRSKAIRLANGNVALVLRVPRSWNVPHRVSAQNSNRFWLRNSGGVHEASMDELRVLFTEASSAMDRVQRFREERIQVVASGRGPRPLVGSGRLFLHIVPLSVATTPSQIDLEAALRLHQAFRPIASMGMSPRFNFEGYINERGGELNHGYTQIFRNGALEATKANLLRVHEGQPHVAGLQLEKQFFEVFESYVNGLKDLGVAAPLIVMVTLEGVEGAVYAVRANPFDDPVPVLDRPTLFLPECVINEYGSGLSYHRAVRPAFDALWNAIGYSGSQFFDESGLWVGDRTRR